jgi:fumarate reductase flavoprotein subunit
MKNAYDVVVIGAGGAGLAAAISAAEAGASVLVVERLDGPYGTTSRAVGSFAAAGTRLQRSAGIVDTAADFAEDMSRSHAKAPSAPELRRLYADHSGETVDWLSDMGVAFVGPYPEPPNRVPRMHNAVPNARAYVQAMMARLAKLPVTVLFGAEARELQLDGKRVVLVHHEGADRHIAASAIIMAAGDFSASNELRQRHLSAAEAAALPINPNSIGQGHEMVKAAGARMEQMDMVFGPQLRFGAPERGSWIDHLPSWPWFRKLAASIVSVAPRWAIAPIVRELLISNMSPVPAMFERGARLVDRKGVDMGQGEAAVQSLALSEGSSGYVIGTAELANQFNAFPNYISTAPGIAFAYFKDYEAGRPDLVTRASSLAELATKLNLPGEALAASCPEMTGKPVFALGPVMAMLTVTEGGAAIDTKCRILREDGTAIDGLYGAGGNGQGGLVLKGHGLHIGWAITSGRIAGKAAAAYVHGA